MSADDKNKREAEALFRDIKAIAARCAALMREGPSAVEHGDFLHDERGLPK